MSEFHEKVVNEAMIRNAVVLVIAGALYRNVVDIEDVPKILIEIAKDYRAEIRKNA